MREQDTLPLRGLQIVEMQSIGPVPFAGRLLADLGADVQRLHAPSADELGLFMPAAFDVLSHRKRTTYLDLKSPAGLEQARALIDAADVLIEGFRPGVLERLGLAPGELLARHPRLVVGRLSGWGSRGAWAQRAGHDINYLALAGVLHAIGTPERPLPPLNLVGDFGGGAMHLLVGVLAALVRRSISGRGGLVESSILAGTHGLTGMFHGLLAGGLCRLERDANLLDGGAPFYRCYATSDGRHMAVGALERRFYAALLALTGLSERIDAAQQHVRGTWPATSTALAHAFAAHTRDEWTQRALALDACVSPVLDFAEAAADAHNRANGWFAEGSVEARAVIGFGSAA